MADIKEISCTLLIPRAAMHMFKKEQILLKRNFQPS